jgi:hypothetical protein
VSQWSIADLQVGMTPEFPHIREFVLRAFAQHAKNQSANAAHITATFDTLCERLRTRLQPLFGNAATQALFRRALQVATAEFEWLTPLVPRGADQCASDELARPMARLTADDLQRGLATVLAYDIALLSEFVGSDLIMPLVQEAWSMDVSDDVESGGNDE